MNRDEFLAKLFSLYASTFNKGNGVAWTDAYNDALDENIDYDKLYKFMLSDYEKSAAPSPAYLSKNATFKNREKETSPTWENIEADICGRTYEFALDCPFAEARTRLESKGFKNVRLQQPIQRTYAV